MKVRPLSILLLFAASAGILVWIYFAAPRERKAPQSPQWAETLADLDACCRHKHIKSMQYDHFADIAETERRPDAARLFRAMAFSERLHEYNCANAIVRFGGHYSPPAKVTVFRGTTDQNLRRSVGYGHRSPGIRTSGDIDRALAAGNRYAARVLIWARAGDTRHTELMARYIETGKCGNGDVPDNRQGTDKSTPAAGSTAAGLHTPKSSETGAGYLVCPVCGNIFTSEYCDPFCPQCLTDGREFTRFGN